jgi:hypothetical protein
MTKRSFEEEFAYQLNNGLCGGPWCINPECFCTDEEEEESDGDSEAS